LDLLFLGNLGNTYFINVKFNEINEKIINQGAIGARNDANPGAIKAITLVEQHTTPLARADAPAIAVDVEDTADVILLEESGGVGRSLISQYGLVTINPP
jgi:predicted nucleic acid-binding protein